MSVVENPRGDLFTRKPYQGHFRLLLRFLPISLLSLSLVAATYMHSASPVGADSPENSSSPGQCNEPTFTAGNLDPQRDTEFDPKKWVAVTRAHFNACGTGDFFLILLCPESEVKAMPRIRRVEQVVNTSLKDFETVPVEDRPNRRPGLAQRAKETVIWELPKRCVEFDGMAQNGQRAELASPGHRDKRLKEDEVYSSRKFSAIALKFGPGNWLPISAMRSKAFWVRPEA